ncbi:MAG: PVC-type heme-binding CxxCH protein [Pirellulaceae bacterium]|nr:PVC-type heme-binding CxxCH protein [Pirellulaceae bacterium]
MFTSSFLKKCFVANCIILVSASFKNVDAQDAANDPALLQFGIYEKTAPRPNNVNAETTRLPLELKPGQRIALIGNTLLERTQQFGNFEAMLQKHYPSHRLIVRNLSWSADAIDVQPRPENFADLEQHLHYEKIDVIFAAFGFNESFADNAGLNAFRARLVTYLQRLRTLAFNGKTPAKIILVSPIANENVAKVNAADLNNSRIKLYSDTMKKVAEEQKVGFVDVFAATLESMESPGSDVTINGCHLTEAGDWIFAATLFKGAFGRSPPAIDESLRVAIIDRDRQYFRRYRPLNTFYYTGGRNKQYGYLDFLPAMQNFELMVANRDERIWAIAEGKPVRPKIDDSNIPTMPEALDSRGVNEWLSPADEQKAFDVDPRFEVNLFASEEQFPEIANPIQMRWDARGRLWVSTSITYPHIYPGNEPQDRIVILEDTDTDGRADKSTVFAENLHVPLSFELGDKGVYVSEQPELTFLEDTDGDDRMDRKRTLMSGFGTEDSHHALHDFTWSPDGDLVFRESIFHHTQVETPYGPVRQQNSGWFRYTPRNERLISFGSYPSTNPWGVAFDDWGRHVASHPIFAAAFHSLDPPYPQQHSAPNGLRAYSGTCGHKFVDSASFPEELQGCFIKARYKPTNRIEMHRWVRQPFGYDEQYLGDLLFSRNLSFIPVDIQFGPRGDLYICDWYNPVKGHAQYSLRDKRRDRSSGRIWRVVAKDHSLQTPPKFEGASIDELLSILKRPEYVHRELAKRLLREQDAARVIAALDAWVSGLSADDPRFRHHQTEALWTYRTIGKSNVALMKELMACENADARAAAVQQMRYTHTEFVDAIDWLRQAIHDSDAMVRMEAVIAASYIGTKPALEAVLEVFKHPMGDHLSYAIAGSLGSYTLRPLWEADTKYGVAKIIKQLERSNEIKEPRVTAQQGEFDSQVNLKTVKVSCEPERMLFTLREFAAKPGQAIKLIFTNPDATDHNLVFVTPGSLAEVGMAANEMAKDPKNADSDFIPPSKKSLIMHASPMIGPTRKSKIHVLRFEAPNEPGVYPYVCTFPGHWIIMNGQMIVGRDEAEIATLKSSQQPVIVNEWTMKDFPNVGDRVTTGNPDSAAITRGTQAFTKALCLQCHTVSGHGVNLGPDLAETIKKYQGQKLLQQILEPSHEIHPKYQVVQFLLESGKIVSGVVMKEDDDSVQVASNLLAPQALTKIAKKDIEERQMAKNSAMPLGMANVLTKNEIVDLLHYLEAGPAPIMPRWSSSPESK